LGLSGLGLGLGFRTRVRVEGSGLNSIKESVWEWGLGFRI